MTADRRGDTEGRSALEWAVFAASSLVIAAIVGVLVWASATGSDAPPAFRTTLREVVEVGSGFAVPVEVANVGGRTAADVVVYAEVGEGEEAVRREQTVDFLFSGDSQVVTYVVDQDPRRWPVRVGVQSYLEP